MSSLRELGRIEGIIGAEERAQRESAREVILKSDAEKMIKTVDNELEAIIKKGVLDEILASLRNLKSILSGFLKNLVPEKRGEINIDEKKNELALLKAKIDRLGTEGKKFTLKYETEITRARREAEETRRDEKRVYQLQQDADIGRKKVERIRVKLKEAGGIDPDVIKEDGDVSPRDEYLSKELGDLKDSREKLEEIMDELEEKLSGDFKTGISKINNEFQRFFETMFGGGSASLKVIKREKRRRESEETEKEGLPSEALAEEGIDIIVDLPRKKIKSLDTLSGGERALTSIALLFAMSAVHPPPFLVLDETDAALDEANSQRYAKMLENLSKTTQLILITHNRSTMKCAGILYGVTMGSDGISKLLSIRFEEAGALVS